ncbi:MAG: hypothetical protein K2N28_03110 [Muribaculaceae bacterium]|nr:hypothetical protein [Muribaculaceae bacterium]
MNKLSALILVFVTSCFVSVAETRVARRWYDSQIVDNGTLDCVVGAGVSRLTVEARAAMHGVKESKGVSPQSWGIELVMADGTSCDITVGWGNTMFGDFTDERYLSVSGLDEKSVARFTKNVNTHDGFNTLIVEFSDLAGCVYVGDDFLNYAGNVTLQSPVVEVKLISHGKLELQSMCVESGTPVSLDSGLDDEALAEASRPGQTAPLGVWHYFDRDNDASYAQPGGDYDLLVVNDPECDGCFLILYFDGARVNASQWHRGMIKGVLTPTPFKGRYELKWYDAGMEPVDDECHASVDDNILTVHFPLHHSQLRYCR